MRVFVPYTAVQPATYIALWRYDPAYVLMEGQHAYGEFMRERWEQGESFVAVEHDVVPWPGAVDQLLSCPELWCAFDCFPGAWATQEAEVRSVAMVCAKYSAQMIRATPGVWDEPVAWDALDLRLWPVARAAGLWPHQHFPAVVNANPAYLGRRRPERPDPEPLPFPLVAP